MWRLRPMCHPETAGMWFLRHITSCATEELKTGDFRPEDAGQLSFYLTAVDRQMKAEHDNATIGLLLCRKQNRLVAEYALSAIGQPIGIAEYQLTQAIPSEFEGSLPTIEQLEAELQGDLPPKNKDVGEN